MATVSGRFVKDFADASHALPMGMHMNADYPFMIPRIIAFDGKRVTIEGRYGINGSFMVRRRRGVGMYGRLAQSSSLEVLMERKPTTFEFRPFKDDNSPAIGEPKSRRAAAAPPRGTGKE